MGTFCGANWLEEVRAHVWKGTLDTVTDVMITPENRVYAWDPVAGCWTSDHDMGEAYMSTLIHRRNIEHKARHGARS